MPTRLALLTLCLAGCGALTGLGGPAADAGVEAGGVDAGGLTPGESAFLDDLVRATCEHTVHCGYAWNEWDQSVDACTRSVVRLIVTGDLADALKDGAITFDPTTASACLAETAQCASRLVPPESDACNVFRRVRGAPLGSVCTVDAECAAGLACPAAPTLGAACAPTPYGRRCVAAVPLGGACTLDGAPPCAPDATSAVSCAGGTCRVTRVVAVTTPGAACRALADAPGGIAQFGDCVAPLTCLNETDGAWRCRPRGDEGAPCTGPGACAPPLECASASGSAAMTCTALRYARLGERCVEGTARVCDASLGLFCDPVSQVCAAGGDGTAGSRCSADDAIFPCTPPLRCIDGVCGAPRARGEPCDLYASCACGLTCTSGTVAPGTCVTPTP